MLPEGFFRWLAAYGSIYWTSYYTAGFAVLLAVGTYWNDVSPERRAHNLFIVALCAVPALVGIGTLHQIIPEGARHGNFLFYLSACFVAVGNSVAAISIGSFIGQFYARSRPLPRRTLVVAALLGTLATPVVLNIYIDATNLKSEVAPYFYLGVLIMLAAFGLFFGIQLPEKKAAAKPHSYPPLAPLPREFGMPYETIPVPAVGPMLLKIQPNQTTNWRGRVVFIIDARIEVPMEEQRLIRKYRLAKMIIYSSSARDRHLEAAKGRSESMKALMPQSYGLRDNVVGLLWTIVSIFMVRAHGIMAAYHLKITVSKLMRGVHVRCNDLNEVLVAKTAIMEAGANLRGYLDVAESFDGREEIHEF